MKASKKKAPRNNFFDKPADGSFCRISHAFIPDSRSRLSNMGAYLLWRQTNGLGLGLWFWTMKSLLTIALGLYVATLWLPNQLLVAQEIISLLGLVVFAIPTLIRSAALTTSKRKVEIFLQTDFWIAVFGIALVAEGFPSVAQWKPLFAFSFCSLWIWFRLFEAAAWRTTLKDNFGFAGKLWSHSVGLTAQRRWLILLSIAAFVFVWLAWRPMPTSSLALALAVSCWPIQNSLLNKLFKVSEKNSWKVFDWQFFKSARSIRILLSHFQGIFTNPEVEVDQIWYESLHEWPEQSIQEVLYKTALTNQHPISAALVKHLSQPKNNLVELQEVQMRPHLGIQGTLKDVQGGVFGFVLGSLGWHRILQTSMSDEGRRFLKNAIDSNRVVTLLSLNETIVAAIAIRSDLKLDADTGASLLAERFKWGVLSSASMKWTPSKLPSSIDFDLFPVERTMLRAQAEDRFHQYRKNDSGVCVELSAPWDQLSEHSWNSVLVSPTLTNSTSDSKSCLQIYSDQVKDITAPFVASEWLHRTTKLSCLIASTAIVLISVIPRPEFAALLLGSAGFMSTWWILKSDIE